MAGLFNLGLLFFSEIQLIVLWIIPSIFGYFPALLFWHLFTAPIAAYYRNGNLQIPYIKEKSLVGNALVLLFWLSLRASCIAANSLVETLSDK